MSFMKAAAINRAMQQRSLVAQVAQVAKILQMNFWTFEQNYKNEQLMFTPVLSFTDIKIYIY